jgi:iron complex outermembrane recepter protein
MHPIRPLSRRTPVALAAAAALLSAPAVFAQQTAPAPVTTTAEDRQTITITATKRNEAAHRVPINVSAIGEEQLREENITDIKKLIQLSPAIDAPGNGARFADSVTVRGLNISSVSANNVEWFVRSTLSYYLDDTPLPNIGYRIKDIARVETLLGPQGTLYGAGALGGTIRYITNQPRLGASEARVSTSFYKTKYSGGLSNDTDGVINLPFGSDLALRLSLARLDEKGYTDRYAGVPSWLPQAAPWTPKPNAGKVLYEDDDYQKVNSGRAALRWRATKDLEFTLAHAQQSQLAHGTTGTQLRPATGEARYTAPFGFNDHTVLSPYPEFADRDFRLTSFDIDWQLSIGKLHSSTSTYKDTRAGQADYLGTGSFFYGDLGLYPEYTLNDPGFLGETAYLRFDNAYKGTVHETRLTSNPGGSFDWIAGFYYAKQDKSLKYTENLPTLPTFRPGGAPGVGYFENQASDYKETAFFGEISIKPADRLTLTAGARFFNYRDETTTEVVDYAFDLVSGVVEAKEKGSAKSYFKLNAAYQITPDFLGYFTISQGFRRGGANGFRPVGGLVLSEQGRAYQPDTTENFELGFKGFLFDKRLYLQTSLYTIDWQNTQTYASQDLSGFPVWGTINGPAAVSKGIEIDGRYTVSPGWQLLFATTYNRARWDGTKEICLFEGNVGCRTFERGGVLGGSPRSKHKLGVRWDTSLANGWGLNALLMARYTGVKPSDRLDAPNERVFDYKSYTQYDANIGINTDKWDASLWVENLTDERALTSFQGTSAVGARTGIRAIYVKPRTIGVNLSYKFW